MSDKYFTTLDAAKILGVSATTIRNWCEQKKIEAVKKEKKGARGFDWNISLSVLQEMLFKEYQIGKFWVNKEYIKILEQEITLAIKSCVNESKEECLFKAMNLAWMMDIFGTRLKDLFPEYEKDQKWEKAIKEIIKIESNEKSEFNIEKFLADELKGIDEFIESEM